MIKSTTILAVKKGANVAIAGDGQVTISGNIVIKHRACKIRRLYQDKVLAGFAGAVADAITLFDNFEKQLESHHGNLRRAAVELAKEWRTDRFLRRLEALLIVASPDALLIISGTGDVVEPDDDIAAIGSGGPYALAAAPAGISKEALLIASEICVYTNDNILVEEI